MIGVEKGGAISKDVEDVGTEPLLSRNSMLLSLIACGGSVSFRKAAPPEAARRSGSGGLHKGVVNNVICPTLSSLKICHFSILFYSQKFVTF